MTKAEFVERFRHELAGLVADAATSARTGAPLAIFLRNSMKTIDLRLAEMYDLLHMQNVNGTAPARKS